MKKECKSAEQLRVADLKTNPVWEYLNDDEASETAVRPVTQRPVTDLSRKLIGTKVRLANGSVVWALISNMDANSSRMNDHFLAISIDRNGEWFHLARYHDFDYATRGPDALARFLGLGVVDVFPISYDVSQLAVGERTALSGEIRKEPKEKLTRAEIITLAVPRHPEGN